MNFDEDYVLAQAALITENQGIETNLADEKLYASEDAAHDGRILESEIASKALSNSQGRLKSEPPELAAILQKLASGPYNASLAQAGQLLASHEAEQKILRRIITAKEQSLAAARRSIERGELALLKLDCARKKSAAILLGVKHLAVVKMVREADESIEVPVGDLLTNAIDNISKLQLEINRKEAKGIL